MSDVSEKCRRTSEKLHKELTQFTVPVCLPPPPAAAASLPPPPPRCRRRLITPPHCLRCRLLLTASSAAATIPPSPLSVSPSPPDPCRRLPTAAALTASRRRRRRLAAAASLPHASPHCRRLRRSHHRRIADTLPPSRPPHRLPAAADWPATPARTKPPPAQAADTRRISRRPRHPPPRHSACAAPRHCSPHQIPPSAAPHGVGCRPLEMARRGGGTLSPYPATQLQVHRPALTPHPKPFEPISLLSAHAELRRAERSGANLRFAQIIDRRTRRRSLVLSSLA